MNKKYKKFVIAFDNHGDMIDKDAEKSFQEFVKWWKPDLRIHGGDAFDLRCLRSGASENEKQEGLKTDIKAGLDFLKWFRPDVFLFGNHDYRLIKSMYTAKQNTLREYVTELHNMIIESFPEKTQVIPWGKRHYYQLGNYKVIHGYQCGINAPRMAAQCYGNVIMGHIHCPLRSAQAHIDSAIGWASGSLCRIDMEYNSGHVNTLSHAHGWMYGLVDGHNKSTTVWQAVKQNGEWVFPSEFKIIK